MRVLIGRKAFRHRPRRAVVTIGMFDGVHIGHQHLIRHTVRLAKQSHGTSLVLTFHPDPQEILDPRRVQPALMPLKTRLELIKAFGVEVLWIIPFTRAFSRLSAEQFLQRIVHDQLGASRLVVGETFSFGKDRQGSLELLRAMGRTLGMRIVIVPPVMRGGAPVSSSRIRRLVQAGAFDEARRLLGRPVELWGRVVHGDARGRRLGFPTANIRLASTLSLPHGVYRVELRHAERRFQGLMNLGVRPTFSRGSAMQASATCEVYLVGFRGTLYGQPVTVSLLKWLRPERSFTSAAALVRQIQRDLVRARLTHRPS